MFNTICRHFGLLLIAGMPMSVASTAYAAQAPAAEYSLQAENPSLGSRIAGDIAHAKSLPLNLTYGQLSPEQRAVVNGWYDKMAPGDEPPFPLKGLEPIIRAVQKVQEKSLVMGNLYLVATVEPNGKASVVKAYSSPDPQMTRIAAEVLLMTRFKPAVCGGKPCRMDFPLHYHFSY